MKTKKLKRKQIREEVTFQPENKPFKSDFNKGIIENVKLLGWKSKNKNRTYKPDGCDPQLYENASCYVDHPDPEVQGKPRSIKDKLGYFTGIYKQRDGIYAKKFIFNPKHPIAEAMSWWVGNAPHKLGFSQNALGDVFETVDGEVVEKVNEVRSIDLVADPATTKGIYEAAEWDEDTKLDKLMEIFEANPMAKNKDWTLEENMDEDEENITEDEQDDDDENDSHKYEDGNPDDEGDSESVNDLEDENGPPDGGEDMQDEPDDEDEDDENMYTGDEGEGEEDDDEDDEDDEDEMEGDGEEGDEVDPSDISDELASAVNKIFLSEDDLKSKIAKIVTLLKLKHHGEVQEGVIYMPVNNLDEAKAVLQESRSPSALMVLDVLDQYEVQALVQEKVALAESLCITAKLPQAAQTSFFMRKLIECTSEREMQEMIEDRRQTAGPQRSRLPISNAQGGRALEEAWEEETPKKSKRLTEVQQKKKMRDFEQSVFEGIGED